MTLPPSDKLLAPARYAGSAGGGATLGGILVYLLVGGSSVQIVKPAPTPAADACEAASSNEQADDFSRVLKEMDDRIEGLDDEVARVSGELQQLSSEVRWNTRLLQPTERKDIP